MSDPNRERPSWFPTDEEIALAYEKDGYEDEGEYPALNRLIERAVLRGQIEAYNLADISSLDAAHAKIFLRGRLAELEAEHE